MFSNRIKKIIRVWKFMRDTHGRIFSVRFITTDGRERVLNAKYLGKPSMIRGHYSVLENNLLHRDRTNCIRAFKALNVLELRCGQHHLTFEGVAK